MVSGVAALMLLSGPGLSPGDVNFRMMDSARPALDPGGEHVYSIYQQGTGLVSDGTAVNSSRLGCTNQGLDVHP